MAHTPSVKRALPQCVGRSWGVAIRLAQGFRPNRLVPDEVHQRRPQAKGSPARVHIEQAGKPRCRPGCCAAARKRVVEERWGDKTGTGGSGIMKSRSGNPLMITMARSLIAWYALSR